QPRTPLDVRLEEKLTDMERKEIRKILGYATDTDMDIWAGRLSTVGDAVKVLRERISEINSRLYHSLKSEQHALLRRGQLVELRKKLTHGLMAEPKQRPLMRSIRLKAKIESERDSEERTRELMRKELEKRK